MTGNPLVRALVVTGRLPRAELAAAIAFLTWEGRIDAARTRGFLDRFAGDRVIDAGGNGWLAWPPIVEQLGRAAVSHQTYSAAASSAASIARERSSHR